MPSLYGGKGRTSRLGARGKVGKSALCRLCPAKPRSTGRSPNPVWRQCDSNCRSDRPARRDLARRIAACCSAHIRFLAEIAVWRQRSLSVVPEVLEARPVVDAVDHFGEALHLRLPAVRNAAVEDDG